VELWQKLFGQGLTGPFLIPFRERDPPAMPVEDHFDAVNAARGWRTISRFARFVCAEDMRHMPKLLDTAVDLFLEESLLR
jgi:hypothetical protein